MKLPDNVKPGDHLYLADSASGKKVTLWGKVTACSAFSAAVSRRGSSGMFRVLENGTTDYGGARFLVHVKPAEEAVSQNPDDEIAAVETILAKKAKKPTKK